MKNANQASFMQINAEERRENVMKGMCYKIDFMNFATTNSREILRSRIDTSI